VPIIVDVVGGVVVYLPQQLVGVALDVDVDVDVDEML
jgi:hypothetical protein